MGIEKKCGWCDSEEVRVYDDKWLECLTCGYESIMDKDQRAGSSATDANSKETIQFMQSNLAKWKEFRKNNPNVKIHTKFNTGGYKWRS